MFVIEFRQEANRSVLEFLDRHPLSPWPGETDERGPDVF